jgi:hypothetical protein
MRRIEASVEAGGRSGRVTYRLVWVHVNVYLRVRLCFSCKFGARRCSVYGVVCSGVARASNSDAKVGQYFGVARSRSDGGGLHHRPCKHTLGLFDGMIDAQNVKPPQIATPHAHCFNTLA